MHNQLIISASNYCTSITRAHRASDFTSYRSRLSSLLLLARTNLNLESLSLSFFCRPLLPNTNFAYLLRVSSLQETAVERRRQVRLQLRCKIVFVIIMSLRLCRRRRLRRRLIFLLISGYSCP